MGIIVLLIFAVVAFLVWMEIIPLRKWLHKICIKASGMVIRGIIAVLSLFEDM